MSTSPPSVSQRLDVLAQVLVGTFAAMAGLLTLVGANSDRVWVWLDQDGEQGWLVGAGVLAVAAIALALVAMVVQGARGTVVVLALASVCYVAALMTALLGAARTADAAGRPTFVQVTLSPSEGDTAQLAFVVRAESVDLDQRVRVVVTSSTGEQLMSTVVRPGASGVVSYEARLPLRGDGTVLLKAVRLDDPEQECPASGDPASLGPACLTLTP